MAESLSWQQELLRSCINLKTLDYDKDMLAAKAKPSEFIVECITKHKKAYEPTPTLLKGVV